MIAPDYFAGGEGLLTPGDAAVALIVLDDGRYLMQRRSQKPGIFFPGHWGLFGGAVDVGETAAAGLRRELKEELDLDVARADYFTEFHFDFSFRNLGRVYRQYYCVSIPAAAVDHLSLGEGDGMAAFAARDILNHPRVVPYDSFAIWLHVTQRPQ